MPATNASATRGLATTARHTIRRHQHHNHHHRARGASGRAPRASTDASAAPSSSSSSPGAPVFETGSTDRDAFDASRVSSPVVKAFRGDDATRWLMWYTATSSSGEDSIGLATSSDGLRWTRSDGDTETYRNDVESKGTDVGRVLTRNDEDWWCFDTRGVVVGDVQLISSDSISGGSVYWMFYHGYDHSSGSESANDDEWTATTRPGLCLSQDGRNWARVEGEHHTGALFDVGEPNEWDASGVRDPKVLLAGPNDIRVYYGSVDAETGQSSVGVATTRDGFVYAKRGARGVFGPGPSGSFDDAGVASPCVVRLGKKEFIMFYEAYSSANPGVASIALATSEDGFVWTRPNAPVLTAGEPGSWDQGGVGRPYAVPMAGDRVRLYYEGRARAGDARGVGVGVAVSAEHDRFAFVRRRARVTDEEEKEDE